MKLIRKSALSGATCLQSAAIAAALLGFAGSTTAFAQENAAQGAEAEKEPAAIVVTGSRIARPNLDSVVPVTSIGGDDFIKQAETNIGDTLNDLPQLRSTFSQQNPGGRHRHRRPESA